MKIRTAALVGLMGLSALTMSENPISTGYTRPALAAVGREIYIRTSPDSGLKRKIDDAGRYIEKGRYHDGATMLHSAYPEWKSYENPDLDDLEALGKKVILRYKPVEGYGESLNHLVNSLRNERAKIILAECLEKVGMEGSKKKEVFLAFSTALSELGTVELAKEKAMEECRNHPDFQYGIYFFSKENAYALLEDMENLAVESTLIDMEKNLIEKDLSRFL